MARLSLDFHPAAGNELARAIGWYLERSEAAADEFILAFDDAVEQIATDPIGPLSKCTVGVRCALVGFPAWSFIAEKDLA